MTCHNRDEAAEKNMDDKVRTPKHRSRRSDAARRKVLKKRLALADELASTPTTTVTLRIPTGLNRWLDAYVHGAWPARVRKQELVVEALRLLIAHRGGAREELVTIDLLEDAQAED
jgi:hypothetical protein